LTEVALYLNQTMLAHAYETGVEPERFGNGSPFGFTGTFDAADAPISLAAPSDRLFERLSQSLEDPGLAADFPDHRARRERRKELEARIGARVSTRMAAEWVALLRPRGIPCAPVRTQLEAAVADEAAGDGFVDRSAGHLTLALPWTADGGRLRSGRHAPRLGEHDEELL
jgi:crotonobetainyl-CoA:carnitine CoA-transferase CaiB-like acyl-CoA transferase